MKKTQLVLMMLTIGLLFYSSSDLKAQPKKSKLMVTVLDGLGNIVEKATVTVYKSEEDYRNNSKSVATGTTDKKGRVKFKDLQPKAYYIDARFEDMNNDGKGVESGDLAPGKLNKVNIVIE